MGCTTDIGEERDTRAETAQNSIEDAKEVTINEDEGALSEEKAPVGQKCRLLRTMRDALRLNDNLCADHVMPGDKKEKNLFSSEKFFSVDQSIRDFCSEAAQQIIIDCFQKTEQTGACIINVMEVRSVVFQCSG